MSQERTKNYERTTNQEPRTRHLRTSIEDTQKDWRLHPLLNHEQRTRNKEPIVSVAIKFENISKQYRLGEIGTGTLSHDLHRAWARLRGKPDPFAKVGGINDRTQSSTKNQELGTKNGAASDYVWALRDINFEVQQGEILGIIGRNGAGKSTLLKILSRVTAPTTGKIKTRGRIASLLEVGTGFHPELTGRENIYLNGSILGMRRDEITKQLDEIVEFSGCAKYIDTPVKRYSSGMTVRLGFAVAAHLDCEILVVDEVLAVGDADFQRKCIGKMQDISRTGRTVLFVSHSLTSMQKLCQTGLLLQNGTFQTCGKIDQAISAYLAFGQVLRSENALDKKRPSWARAFISSAAVIDANGLVNAVVPQGCDIRIRMNLLIPKGDVLMRPVMGVVVRTQLGETVGNVNTRMTATEFQPVSAGEHSITCTLITPTLIQGSYTIDVWLGDGQENVDVVEDAALLSIVPSDVYGSGVSPFTNSGNTYFMPKWAISQTRD